VSVATISSEDPVAVAAVAAIRAGDLAALRRLLAENPRLATARLGDDYPGGMSRTLLHVATDWPGHFPGVAATVAVLVAAGAEVNARFRGPHEETPLHWAASSDDVEALDALLDAGADIEAPGAVLGGGPPLADARGFKQWKAAFRLVERGARTTLVDAATLGLLDRVQAYFADAEPTPEEITRAFWGACHGGRHECAEYLLDRGAELNWIPPWENLTPLDAAEREGADVVRLEGQPDWYEQFRRARVERMPPPVRRRYLQLRRRRDAPGPADHALEAELRRLSARTDFADPDGMEHLVKRQEAELTAVNDDVNRTLGANFQRFFATPTVRQRLRALDLPVLLVHGQADPRPAAAVEALASELRHSRLVVLDRVGHFPYWEAPEALRSLLRDLLAAPSSRRPTG
jgi:uncharacterized protein